jgi:hypothetical protein
MITPPPDPDDDEADVNELETAADETPTDAAAPEVSKATENLVAWDDPPDSAGHEAPRVLPEDEASVAEQLVEKGVDAADRERRIAAADPDFEP